LQTPKGPLFSLPGKVTLFALVLLLLGAGVAAGIAALGAGPWQIFVFTAAVMVPVGAWLMARFFYPAQHFLQALKDGVQSSRDRDFSMRLVDTRRDELGELARVFNEMSDVLRSERKNLLQKEMMLDSVFQSSPTAIVLTNPNGRIVFSNRAAKTLLGSGRRLEGHSFQEIMESCPEEMRDVIAGGTDALFTVPSGKDDEETYHLSQRVFHLNAQRHTMYMVKRLTHELRRQEVAVWKKVIRVMSHELNNTLAPITSLFHSARTVADRPEHADKLDTIFESIEERTSHLKDFLEGYARFARLPRPRKQLVEWEDFLGRLQQIFPFRNPGEAPQRPGYFDASQVQQALINLLKNASEAGSPPEDIELSVASPEDGGTRIQVLDRGKGMDEDVLRQALLPFYSSKSTGTGLGLPLCREILEAHGGTLRIQNRRGGGTTVTCWLPSRPGN
jgi:nitrogen fixation/metabolism regulation signal transduction histidine kinase